MNLNEDQFEEYLIEIITGKKMFDYGNSIYAVSFPATEERDAARILYIRTKRMLINTGLPPRDYLRKEMDEKGLLPRGHYNRIKVIEMLITENESAMKITNSKEQEVEINMTNEKLKEKLREFKLIEEGILINTAESRAEETRLGFLVSKCVFTGESLSDRVWETYTDYKNSTNTEFSSVAKRNFMIMNFGISNEIIRAVARHPEWRYRWNASKKTGAQLFKGDSSSWDKNKISLCYWSDFYDTIYEYPEPPSEEVINNDEKLFQWISNVNRVNKSKGKSNAGAGGQTTLVNESFKVKTKKNLLEED